MKKILSIILCLSLVLSSAVPSLAMGFTEDTTNGGVHYTEETRYQVYDGVVYDMYWGIPDSIAQLYGLHMVTRYQDLPYWVVCLNGSASSISASKDYTKQNVVVIQFDYDGNNIPTNVNNCLGDISDSSAVSVQLRRLAYYFLNQYVYTDNSYRNTQWSEHLNFEYNLDYGLLSMYYYPKMSNANFYFNDGELMIVAIPSPDNADLGFEDAVIDPTDDWDDYFADDGNLKPDDTDYGIFTPIVNFFKMILYRLKAIYAFIRTIHIAIVNALRLVLTDPINSVITAIDGWQHFFDNFDINVTDKLKEWSEFFTGFDDKMETLFSDMLTGLGDKIVESIKGVFLPSDGFFDEKVEFLKNKINVTFGISAYDLSDIMRNEKSFTDIELSYKGAKSAKIVDFSFVNNALATFRPIIRGIITLWLVFYNINQFLGFIGQGHISLGSLVNLGTGGNSGGGESKWDYLVRVAGGMK